MNGHVPEDILQAFVDGEVDEQVAIHVAMHLDDCPRCATRAAHLEPLATAFAATDDPTVPDDLLETVLAAALTPQPRFPLLEVGLGGALLAAAAALLLVGTGPTALVFGAADWVSTLPRLSNLAAQISMSALGLSLAFGLFVAGSGVALGLARRTS